MGRREPYPVADPDAPHLPWAPTYVRRCVDSPWDDAPMILRLWRKGTDPSKGIRKPHKCGSWRCPACRRFRASVDYARIAEAFAPFDHRECVFLVLTLDQNGTHSGNPWPDRWTAYRELSRMSRNLLSRLRRAYPGDIGSRWVSVVESHRSGWPHMNLLVHAPTLAAELRRSIDGRRSRDFTDRECILLADELLRHCVETGWGPQSTAEPVRDPTGGDNPYGSLAGYLVKLAADADAGHVPNGSPKAGPDKQHAEIAKVFQVPEKAPKGFRRLRSGSKFLPAPTWRASGGDWTGALLRRDACGNLCNGGRRKRFAVEGMEKLRADGYAGGSPMLQSIVETLHREHVARTLEINAAIESEAAITVLGESKAREQVREGFELRRGGDEIERIKAQRDQSANQGFRGGLVVGDGEGLGNGDTVRGERGADVVALDDYRDGVAEPLPDR